MTRPKKATEEGKHRIGEVAVGERSGGEQPDGTYRYRCFTGGFGTGVTNARIGIDCELILKGKQPAVPDGNLLLDTLYNAKIKSALVLVKIILSCVPPSPNNNDR